MQAVLPLQPRSKLAAHPLGAHDPRPGTPQSVQHALEQELAAPGPEPGAALPERDKRTEIVHRHDGRSARAGGHHVRVRMIEHVEHVGRLPPHAERVGDIALDIAVQLGDPGRHERAFQGARSSGFAGGNILGEPRDLACHRNVQLRRAREMSHQSRGIAIHRGPPLDGKIGNEENARHVRCAIVSCWSMPSLSTAPSKNHQIMPCGAVNSGDPINSSTPVDTTPISATARPTSVQRSVRAGVAGIA